MILAPMSVVETPGFLRYTVVVFTHLERVELVTFLAANPEEGDIVPETGGARVINYYHNQSLPLFLLNVFAKNEKHRAHGGNNVHTKARFAPVCARFDLPCEINHRWADEFQVGGHIKFLRLLLSESFYLANAEWVNSSGSRRSSLSATPD